MNFENHIFISYAHVDNKKTPDVAGWITRFHESLESYLSHNLGGDAVIWRDEKLEGTDIFGNAIVNQFPKTAVLVSILSERYLKSEWCLKEVNEFCRVVGDIQPGLIVDDKARVVKVMLKPIPAGQRELLPPIMQEALGYEFYEKVEGQRTLLLDPAFGEEYGQAYRRKIYFLADDVAELVKKLEATNQAPRPAVPAPGAAVNGEQASDRPTIYLAECGYDRWEDREKIHGELREHGYTILPEQRLPDLEKDYIDEVDRLLDRCDLSIHLIGEGDGGRPAGPGEQSVVALQHALALEKSKTDGLPRVIWLPQETVGKDEKHQAFIKALREDSAMHFKADLLAGNLEELKRETLNTLKKQEEPEASQASETAGGNKVYVICDARDLDLPDLGLLLAFLGEQDVEITYPLFEGNAAEVSEANEAQLKNCDAVLLFFGAGDGAWKRAQESEIKRVQGLRIDKPLLARFTYLAGTATPDKKMLKLTQKNGLIDGLGGFSETLMEPFVKALKPH